MKQLSNKPKKKRKSGGKSKQEIRDDIVRFFKRVWGFIKKHKVISIIVCVLLVLVITGAIVVNHFLSKINYVPLDTSNSQQVKTVTLASGEVIDLSRLTRDADGTYTLSDGRRVDEYGTVWNTDGSVIFYDGSYVNAQGVAVFCDGTTIYTDGNVIFQNGSLANGLKITVNKDGWATFSNEAKAHICAFTIASDGTIVYKNEEEVPEKYRKKTEGKVADDEEDDENAISDAMDDPNLKGTLEEGNKGIQMNFNDNNIWYSNDVTNILLLGIDSGENRKTNSRSDAMILVSVNRKTKDVKMVSFSRAAYVAIQGHDNTRLSHAYEYGGAALTIDTIERNYKIRIDNYASTTFETFKEIINSIGGVNITLTGAEAKALKSKIQAQGLTYNGAGSYNMLGELALNYVRLRKIDTDHARTQRQRNVLNAIAQKMKSMNVLELSAMLNKVLPLVTTDLTKTQLLSQIGYVPSYLSGNIEQAVIPHSASPLQLRGDFEVLILNWDKEISYLHELLYSDVSHGVYQK